MSSTSFSFVGPKIEPKSWTKMKFKIPVAWNASLDADPSCHSIERNFPVVGQFVKIFNAHLITTGSESSEQILYMRKGIVDFFNAILTHLEGSAELVVADVSPGQGKTTTLYLLSCYLAVRGEIGESIVWFNVVNETWFMIKKEGDSKCSIRVRNFSQPFEVFACKFSDWLRENVKYLIVDGATASNPEQFEYCLQGLLDMKPTESENSSTLKIIVTSSMGFYVKSTLFPGMERERLEPWLLHDYLEMVEDFSFFESIWENLLNPLDVTTLKVHIKRPPAKSFVGSVATSFRNLVSKPKVITSTIILSKAAKGAASTVPRLQSAGEKGLLLQDPNFNQKISADEGGASSTAMASNTLELSEEEIEAIKREQCEQLFSSRVALVKNKFQLAGFSVRWMYCFSYELVSMVLATDIGKIDINKVSLGLLGDKSDVTVNSLIVTTAVDASSFGRTVLVSDAACRLIAKRTTESFLVTALGQATNHPVMDGLVLEIDALYHLRNNTLDKRIRLIDSTSTHDRKATNEEVRNRYWHTGVLVFERYDRLDTLAKADTNNAVAFQPELFNNGGFDFVVVKPDYVDDDRFDAQRYNVDIEEVGVTEEDLDYGDIIGDVSICEGEGKSRGRKGKKTIGGQETQQASSSSTSSKFYATRELRSQKHKAPTSGPGLCAEFVQVTRGNSHSLKLFYMHTFITTFNNLNRPGALKITRAKVTILVPRDREETFVIPTDVKVTGDLTQFKWGLDDLELVGFIRTGQI